MIICGCERRLGYSRVMRTRPCPHCSEVIPADVDYCPFCGNTTLETLETEEDLIRLRNLEERQAEHADIGRAADGLPPEAGEYICLMCHINPATIEDYCLECHEKLDLKPEHWDNLRRERMQRNLLIGGLIAIIIIMAIIMASSSAHRHHRSSPAPSAGSTALILLS